MPRRSKRFVFEATCLPNSILCGIRRRVLAFRFSRAILLAAMLGCFLFLNYFLLPSAIESLRWSRFTQGTTEAFLLGQYVAQVNLIAVWAVLGGGSWLFRLPLLFLLTMIHWISCVSGYHYDDYGFFLVDVAEYEWVTLGAYLLLSVSLACTPWVFARYIWGWRLAGHGEEIQAESRFDLKEIFIVFGILAVMLGVLRIAGNLSGGGSFLWDSGLFLRYLETFGRMFVLNAVVCTPSVWAGLRMEMKLTNIAIWSMLFLAPLCWIALLLQGNFVFSTRGPGELAFISYVCSQSIVPLVSLLTLRWTGLRLITRADSGTEQSLVEQR